MRTAVHLTGGREVGAAAEWVISKPVLERVVEDGQGLGLDRRRGSEDEEDENRGQRAEGSSGEKAKAVRGHVYSSRSRGVDDGVAHLSFPCLVHRKLAGAV